MWIIACNDGVVWRVLFMVEEEVSVYRVVVHILVTVKRSKGSLGLSAKYPSTSHQ